jgi:hypothetical protein
LSVSWNVDTHRLAAAAEVEEEEEERKKERQENWTGTERNADKQFFPQFRNDRRSPKRCYEEKIGPKKYIPSNFLE